MEGTEGFDLQRTSAGGAERIAVSGELDAYTAPQLRKLIDEVLDTTSTDVVVDLSATTFIDSTGLGVLVGGLKRVRAHEGSLRLVCTQERILKIFRITGLTKVFPIHTSVEEAVSATD